MAEPLSLTVLYCTASSNIRIITSTNRLISIGRQTESELWHSLFGENLIFYNNNVRFSLLSFSSSIPLPLPLFIDGFIKVGKLCQWRVFTFTPKTIGRSSINMSADCRWSHHLLAKELANTSASSSASSQHPLSVRVASDAFRWSKKRSLVVDGRVLGLSRKKEKANLWIKLAMFYLPLWLEMEHKLFDILTLKQLSNLDSFHSSPVPPTNCNLELSHFFLMVSFFRAWFL